MVKWVVIKKNLMVEEELINLKFQEVENWKREMA